MAPESSNPPYEGSGSAIDDDDDEAENDFAEVQRTLSQKRREVREASVDSPIQRVLPFPFSPNIRPLTSSDQAACVALEQAAFPNPDYQASPEKIEYRLTKCPELCLGVFCTVVPEEAKDFDLATLPLAKPVETDRQNGAVSVLLAHIVATRSNTHVVADADMDYPRDWKSSHGKSSEVGHQEDGRTVAIHSLAVAPRLQGCGLGKLIMKSYLQQINNSGTAERVALICQHYLVTYYQRFGFQHLGESKSQFGGGGWHDMVFELAGPPKPHITTT